MEPGELRDRFDLETSGSVTVLDPEEEKARAGVEKVYLAYRKVCVDNGWTVPPVDLVVRQVNLGKVDEGGEMKVRPYETRVMVLPSSDMGEEQLKQIVGEIRNRMEEIIVFVPARVELTAPFLRRSHK